MYSDSYGILSDYHPADKVVEVSCLKKNVDAAQSYAAERMRLFTLFERNCVKCAALALCGDENEISIVRYFSEV